MVARIERKKAAVPTLATFNPSQLDHLAADARMREGTRSGRGPQVLQALKILREDTEVMAGGYPQLNVG